MVWVAWMSGQRGLLLVEWPPNTAGSWLTCPRLALAGDFKRRCVPLTFLCVHRSDTTSQRGLDGGLLIEVLVARRIAGLFVVITCHSINCGMINWRYDIKENYLVSIIAVSIGAKV